MILEGLGADMYAGLLKRKETKQTGEGKRAASVGKTFRETASA